MKLTGFDYVDQSEAVIHKKLHTLLANVSDGELEIDFWDGSEATFKPLQMHFHAPSEHTIDGKHMDLELHIVHTYKDTGGLGAVLGIFFDMEHGGATDNLFIEEMAP